MEVPEEIKELIEKSIISFREYDRTYNKLAEYCMNNFKVDISNVLADKWWEVAEDTELSTEDAIKKFISALEIFEPTNKEIISEGDTNE